MSLTKKVLRSWVHFLNDNLRAMKKVSVVILNWNGAAVLRSFLPSVVSCSTGDNVEVCVADNGSTDDSVAWVRENFPTVRLVLLPQNYGFAEGYNQALAQIDAEYVVLLNSDVEVTPHWLEPMVTYLDAHPEVAGCQPKLLSQKRKTEFEYAGGAGGYMDKYGYPFCRGRIFGDVEQDRGQYNEVVPVLWATGAALFIRREDYVKAGGLDARFFAHMEEIDLCWRLRNRGRGLVCVPQSVVYHVGAATLKKENPRKTFLNFRNNLLMLYKNLPEQELTGVMRMRAFLDLVAFAVFALKGDLSNAKAVWQARKEFKQMRPSYAEVRQANLKAARVDRVPERVSFCLLWQYYAKGRKFFSQLPVHR